MHRQARDIVGAFAQRSGYGLDDLGRWEQIEAEIAGLH